MEKKIIPKKKEKKRNVHEKIGQKKLFINSDTEMEDEKDNNKSKLNFSKNYESSSNSSDDIINQNEVSSENEKLSSSSKNNNSSSSSSDESRFFTSNTNEIGKIRHKIEITEKQSPSSLNEENKFLKDQKYIEDSEKIEQIINEISEELYSSKGLLEKEIEEIYKNKQFFEQHNFILTDLSCKRMAEIIHYIKSGNPVLLEGDTGTAKTRTSVIACEYLKYLDRNNNEQENDKKNNNKFNLSSDTKIDNLLNKYVGDKNSLTGLKLEYGAFYNAFIGGKYLILDEINLAPKEVLDCIGQA